MDTSYLAQQVTTIIGQLHGLFDDIGVSNHDRDAREAEVCSCMRSKIGMLTRRSCFQPFPKPCTISSSS